MLKDLKKKNLLGNTGFDRSSSPNKMLFNDVNQLETLNFP